MDLRRSTETSLLAGRAFGKPEGQKDPYRAPLRREQLAALVRRHADDRECALALPWSCIELDGATALGGALRGSAAVTSLDLSFNALGDGGAMALAGALRGAPSALIVLNLSQNKICDAGAAAVAALVQAPGCVLAEVALNGNEIGDLGASALANAVRKAPALRKLWLSDNTIGSRGADALADALGARADLAEEGVLWLGNQRPLLEPYPVPPAPAPGRIEGAIQAADQRFVAEVARTKTWPEESQYGKVLAESHDSNFSGMARQERYAHGLRGRLEDAAAPAARGGGEGAEPAAVDDPAAARLAALNADNAALQARVDSAKSALQRLETASGSRGFAHPESAAAVQRERGLVRSLPVEKASTVRGQSWARAPAFDMGAPPAWHKQHDPPNVKPPEVFEKQRAEMAPRYNPSFVEGSLGMPNPRTTGGWPTSG